MALQEVDFAAFPATKKLEKIAEASAEGKIVNFGWIRPEKRDDAQEKAFDSVNAELPRFGIRGSYRLEARRYALWKAVRQLLGSDPTWVWQQTGSCVGASTGNTVMVLQGVEIVIKREAQEYRYPWWLYAYGRSRYHSGIRGRGEGSLGAGMADALLTDGIFEIDPAGEPDLPDPTIRSGWAIHPASLEMDWSDGARISANWIKVGKTRLVKTVARIRTPDEMIAANANGYTCYIASMFGFSPMVPATEGKSPDQVRLVRRWNATWSHQMPEFEFWDHPDLGPIFGMGQNWGPSAHNPNGETPSGYPNCMYYVTYELMGKILAHSDTEAYSLSAYDGFPARESELRFEDFDPFR